MCNLYTYAIHEMSNLINNSNRKLDWRRRHINFADNLQNIRVLPEHEVSLYFYKISFFHRLPEKLHFIQMSSRSDDQMNIPDLLILKFISPREEGTTWSQSLTLASMAAIGSRVQTTFTLPLFTSDMDAWELFCEQ